MEETFLSHDLGNLSIFVTGKEQCKPNHSFSIAFPDQFLIHYIVSGKGVFRSEGKEYHLCAGDAFFIGNQCGYYQADDKDPWTYIWINFSGEIGKHFLKMVRLDTEHPVYTTTDKAQIEQCFERMLHIHEEKNDFLVYSKFFYLLGKMVETSANDTWIHKKTTNQYVQRCCEFIHTNYYRSFTVRDLCRIVGLEYSYLFRLFHRYLGVSPGEYLIRYRMSKAAFLLTDTNMSVNDIASAVGYKDRVAFSKIFTKRYKLSPQTYRKRR